ncbi:MAG TPA: Crp/Fnr family transcriptional regulator [Terriglobales bacterium]|nr:Crp/Fnr family transcriptional regulator [Terriglobales bacterium]
MSSNPYPALNRGVVFTASSELKPRFDPVVFFTRHGLGGTLLHFKKRAALFSQSRAADAVFYIQSGRVKLSAVSRNGCKATIALLSRGDFVGEECLAQRQPVRVGTAVAIAESLILRIERKAMEDAIRRDSAFLEFFLMFLLARQKRMQEDLINQVCLSSEQRLARLLLLLAGFSEGQTEAVAPRISQQVLAEMVGTTRSRVSYFMNRFRERGMVEYNGQFQIRRSLISVITGKP